MTGDAITLKERVDKLVTALSNGSFTESLKSELSSSLKELETLNVDRDVLQNTRIGSSLTKLSKSLQTFCKDSSQRVTDIIEKWKNQLRSSPEKNPAKKQKTFENEQSPTNLTNSTDMNRNLHTPLSSDGLGPNSPSNYNSDLGRLNSGLSFSSPNLTSYSSRGDLTTTLSPGESNYGSNTFSKDGSKTLGSTTDTSGMTTVTSGGNTTTYSTKDSSTLTNNVGNVGGSGTVSNVSGVGENDLRPISESNPNLNLSTGSLSDPGKEDDSDIPSYSGPLQSDAFRNKALKYLFRCFLLGQDFSPEVGKLSRLVYEVESSLYDHYIVNKNSQKEYNLQLKCIAFNLKDIKNVFFNYKLYSGVISPSDLATMSSLQMASDEKKLERSEILEQSLEACQSDWAIKNIFLSEKSQGQFKCWKCNSRQTTYYQLQTRSSDEPMTTFVTCLNCKNRWRF